MENIQRPHVPPQNLATGVDDAISPMEDAIDYLRAYARQKPEMAALWCFGIGFVLGWKLKPW